MNVAYSLTSKFQITIPKEIREGVRLAQKDKLSFRLRGNEIVMKKVPTLAEVQAENQRLLRERGIKPATDEDIKRARENFYKKGMTWE